MQTFQDIIFALKKYWSGHNCVLFEAYDAAMGAGTFHPATALHALGEKTWRTAYVQPSRRPSDGRYGENPNRLYTHHQFQVFLKPAPQDSQLLYLNSLQELGIDCQVHDIRFVEDNWESPTLGAGGVGWEVWCDGMEITQFTYFQKFGGIECRPVPVEITYGLERLAMYVQGVDNVYNLIFIDGVSYGDIFSSSEEQECIYAFKKADPAQLFLSFEHSIKMCETLIENQLIIPAYRFLLDAVHMFNMLDARGSISIAQRKHIILRLHALSSLCLKANLPVEPQTLKAVEHKYYSSTVKNTDFVVPKAHKTDCIQKNRELFIELLVEEIPAKYQKTGTQGFLDALTVFLTKVGARLSGARIFYTPRRMVVYWKEVFFETQDIVKEIKGPLVDAPAYAIDGFLKKMNATQHECEHKTINGKRYLIYKEITPCKNILTLLSNAITYALRNVKWKHAMRIGVTDFVWIRPIQDIYVVYAGARQCIDLNIEGFSLKSSGYVFGHRFLSKKALSPTSWEEYQKGLREQYVILDPQERSVIIRNKLEKLFWIKDESLLNEVTNLVEYPFVLDGIIPDTFLHLPLSVIAMVLRTHQRFFICRDNRFAVVVNIISGQEEIMKGYMRVLTARLRDSVFFINQDTKQSLNDFREYLHGMQDFQDTMYTTTEQLASLTKKICARLFPHVEESLAHQAGALSKADLATSMVREFPKLQGIIGGYYTENEALKEALTMQYMPIKDNDPVPHGELAIALALADKLYRLVLFWRLGKKPTGSGDPYALRRSALGIIRILWENGIPISLEELINISDGDVDLLNFLVKRLDSCLREEGISPNVISAMRMKHLLPLDIVVKDCCSIYNFMMENPGKMNEVIHLTKRFKNIISDSCAGLQDVHITDLPILHDPLEKKLLVALIAVSKNPSDWEQYYFVSSIANEFFDCCMVKGHKEREILVNYAVCILTKRVDFSCIEGDES